MVAVAPADLTSIVPAIVIASGFPGREAETAPALPAETVTRRPSAEIPSGSSPASMTIRPCRKAIASVLPSPLPTVASTGPTNAILR
jgi:hypothetical protein